MPRALIVAIALLGLLPAGAEAQTSLQKTLSKAMAGAGPASGAYVMDSQTDEQLFATRPDVPRSLASNTKLFTTAAVLTRWGTDSTLATDVLGAGSLEPDGTWRGSLYLRGGGDPTFGSRAFTQDGYGSDASVEALAGELADAGFTRVTGRVYGDETLFDGVRGIAYSGFRTSRDVGPLSALNFNHGYLGGFLANPPLTAAQKLTAALKASRIGVRGKAVTGPTPSGAVTLAEVRSPDVARLVQIENKDSDNFVAETLIKGVGISDRPGGPLRKVDTPLPTTPSPTAPQAASAPAMPTRGSTYRGTRAAIRAARSLGAKVKLSDGSGLSRADKAAPRQVATLLDHMRDRPEYTALFNSLPIAGRDGTLDNRMRSGPARGHCRAKTGTLVGVSALSGYCQTKGGRTVVFSILMNGVYVTGARKIQDRMVQAIAGYTG
jgi:D-alanyl-D-alanine carboxypeptidase/D-alanyl-D-alanine-endopeptidase (penicillin-binding protein 4)